MVHESIVIEEEQAAVSEPSTSSAAVQDGRCCPRLAVA